MIDLIIVVCTYNRSRHLKKCIDSLLAQLNDETEIIVIDNNSTDNTGQIVREFSKGHKNIRYFLEYKVGLSHARNRGIKEANSDWILYLDDDVIAFPDLVERALYLIGREDFDCIGGNYIGYTEFNRPKWLPAQFESYIGNLTQLAECDYNIPIGCNVLYRKQALIDVGIFDTLYGMKGKLTGYGDETELQLRLKKQGFRIGFDPLLKVFHVIREDKLKLIWHLKSSFAHGRDGNFNKNYSVGVLLMKNFLSLTALFFKRIPFNTFKLITSKDFYWQNFILNSLNGNLFYFGMIMGKLFSKTDPAYDKDRKIHLT
jgi:glucosyl-dolichyl phosphate glucuronosyltransferase